MPGNDRKSGRWGIIVALAVLLVVTGYGVWGWIAPDRAAEQAVRDYLRAVAQRDLDTVQRFVPDAHLGERGSRVALANGPDWTVDEVELSSWTSVGEITPVSVTISGPDGVAATHEFQLVEEDGWRISNGFAELTFSGPLSWVDVNGERVSTKLPLRLLPGVYDFGQSLDEWFDAAGQQRALLGRSYEMSLLGEDLDGSRTALQPGAELMSDVEDDVNDVIDECVRLASEGSPGCLMGEQVADPDGVGDATDWEVTQYPELDAVDDGSETFRLQAAEPAIVSYDDGELSRDCEVHVDELAFDIAPEGTLRVMPSDTGSRADVTWASCS